MKKLKEKTKEKKKLSKGKKALVIILCIICFIAVASALFINIVTHPSKDPKNYHPVGGMVISDTVEYKSDSAKSIRHNPIVRIMQMVWRFCEDGDNKKHASQTPPSNTNGSENIAYIDDGNIYHRLDMYFPEEENLDITKLPVIIDIHGGGWMYAEKDLNEYYCLELASRGYVVFNISYRLVPDVTTLEQIQDCMAALAFIKQNYQDSYSFDSVMLTGDSAGGMLAAYCAAIINSPELQKTFNTATTDLEIDSLVLTSPVAFMKDGGAFSIYTKLMWGDYRNDKVYGELMDLDKILEKSTLPPTYLITSGGDSLAHEQTHRAYDLLQKKGIESEIADFGDDENGKPLPHVFSILFPFDKSGQQAIDGSLEFYQKHIK